jgi:predicted dinucleotide-binding enzyme
MTTITIIGSGNMASAIGTRAATHGHTIEIMSRDTDKSQALARQIGGHTTVDAYGARPLGEIVLLAVLFTGVLDVISTYGDALAGKILVDMTNPFNADASGLVTTAGDSATKQITALAPEGTHIVKAFNTIFRNVVAQGKPVDVFFAGDNVEAKAHVGEFLKSLDMRPLDAGGVEMTSVLEWAGILLVGVASNGAGFDIALGATTL